MFFNLEYFRTPLGISKGIALGLSLGTVLFSSSCRPTELQKEVVASIWKEAGLLYVAMYGVLLSVVSFAICLFTINFYKQLFVKRVDYIFYFLAGVNLLIFGAGTIESTLTIHVRIGDCCEQFHQVPGTTNCTLPGFIVDVNNHLHYFKVPIPGPPDGHHQEIILPACNNASISTPWLCTKCLNQLIQPKFLSKGASGALGIITSIFFLIVVFVAVKEIRGKKVQCMPD